MKRVIPYIIAIIFLSDLAFSEETKSQNPAQDEKSNFSINMTMQEVNQHLGILTVESLNVGEQGLISGYGWNFCLDGYSINIPSIIELESKPNIYTPIYEIMKLPNNRVSIDISDKGSDKIDIVEALIKGLPMINQDCSRYINKRISVYKVDSIMGFDSLKEMLNDIKKTGQETKIDTPIIDPKNDEAWILNEGFSPIDDSPRVTLYKQSESRKESLIIRCFENKTEAFINANEYVGRRGISVTYRYDSDKKKTGKFSTSTDGKAIFFKKPITHIKEMLKSGKFIIRFTPYNESTITATFDLKKLSEYISPLRSACNW